MFSTMKMKVPTMGDSITEARRSLCQAVSIDFWLIPWREAIRWKLALFDISLLGRKKLTVIFKIHSFPFYSLGDHRGMGSQSWATC